MTRSSCSTTQPRWRPLLHDSSESVSWYRQKFDRRSDPDRMLFSLKKFSTIVCASPSLTVDLRSSRGQDRPRMKNNRIGLILVGSMLAVIALVVTLLLQRQQA